ncbi:MAG: hypothetical protein N2490_01940 [Ignavibacteria bacterium]|nr:hypothetical protein [Ignavibacteria bacterium]
MKNIIGVLLIILSFIIPKVAFSQSKSIVNNDYQFYFETEDEFRIIEIIESSNKISIVYKISMKIPDATIKLDTIYISILAFKWEEIKKLSDFVYNMEKEITFLNLPDRIGDYEEFDSVYYDAKIGRYKNDEFYHLVYYLRTKDDTHIYNFTYLIDVKVSCKFYNDSLESVLKKIAESFVPVKKSLIKD